MSISRSAELDTAAAMRRTWYVLHVKPRAEKKVDECLSALRVFHYLPVFKKVSKVQRRRVVRYLPMFPGYVFTRLSQDERSRVLGTHQVVHAIEVLQARRMIHQLRQIRRAVMLPADLKVVQNFDVGECVRVVSGPLCGVEGRVVRRGAEFKLVLSIDILGRALEVSVLPTDLQKL